MGTTTNHSLRYPEDANAVAVPADVKKLADDVDAKIIATTGGTVAGNISFVGNTVVQTPTNNNHAATKLYVDTATSPFATTGNLFTANQASVETDTTGFAPNGSTIARSTAQASHGSASLLATASGTGAFGARIMNVPVTAGETYTCVASILRGTGSRAGHRVYVGYSGGGGIGSATAASTSWTDRRVTFTVPSGTTTVTVYISADDNGSAGDSFYADKIGLWKGAGGQWAMPGTPITGQSHIAVNNAVHLSGTGAPGGVITAPPGSTFLQTDATTDVKGWIRWIKATGTGSTGWIAGPEADTGRRDVSALLLNSWTTASAVYIRRIGYTVHLYGAIRSQDGNASSMEFLAQPTGFGIQPVAVVGWVYNTATSTASHAIRGGAGNWTLLGSEPSNQNLNFHISAPVDVLTQTWPSSLPGSAA